MDRIQSHSVASYLRVSIILVACLLLALAFVLLFASASVTATTSITTTAISTNTFTPTSTVTTQPTFTPAPTSTPCAIQFSDVPPGSTYYDTVTCLVCRGVINGYPDGTFRPGDYVTRGQLSKIAVNAAHLNQSIPPDRQTFEDVPIGSTFWWHIEQLAQYGAVSGYPCGGPGEPCIPPSNRPYFRPGTLSSRGQTAQVIDDVAGYGSPCYGQTFEDVPPGAYFYCHIQRLSQFWVVSGYPCGGPGEPCVPPLNRPYYRPGSTSTRGQVAKMTSTALLGCPPYP
jgi:hypothetical protein